MAFMVSPLMPSLGHQNGHAADSTGLAAAPHAVAAAEAGSGVAAPPLGEGTAGQGGADEQ
eukprot:CAMPEP_0203899548 /NCGR_PEP_ID=MMETSP0359-20131031/41940_1 /ASSEMBLY_ACC=CAM_ASM_000338 /TAXON_ID=268821 /ORGANISM="Scrippsiella Hangoei, Strain SHTV-5" /LENGTH=59 /DNA_ID=CAMNT_0050822817 /DNA_START=40 /DNA_END=216 /DNA_ORIENTATION=+